MRNERNSTRIKVYGLTTQEWQKNGSGGGVEIKLATKHPVTNIHIFHTSGVQSNETRTTDLFSRKFISRRGKYNYF
jgi:hypothetical protein